MLVERDLMIVLVVLTSYGECPSVDLAVKVEQILGHNVQEMCQASSLICLLVMNCIKHTQHV